MTETMTLSGEDHAAVSSDASAVTAPTQYPVGLEVIVEVEG
jgi:hypothetical protein